MYSPRAKGLRDSLKRPYASGRFRRLSRGRQTRAKAAWTFRTSIHSAAVAAEMGWLLLCASTTCTASAPIILSRLADANGREIAQHHCVDSWAIGTTHRRLAQRPDALDVVEVRAGKLRRQLPRNLATLWHRLRGKRPGGI